VQPTEATQSTNSTTPVKNDDQQMDNSPERQPQTLEQGNPTPEVTPNNTPNDQGINSGTTSDSILRERRDQDDMKPEE